MKKGIISILSLFILSFVSFGQIDFVHTDLKKALKKPLDVYQLDLSKQKLSKKDISKIADFSNLVNINLSCTWLDYFPATIFNCKKLKSVDLSNNSISIIPAEISELSILEELNLGHNDIKELPGSITGLVQLKVLDLSSNYNLKTFPEEFYQLQSLESISCQISKTMFENVICRFRNLKKIDIYSNEFISPCLLLHFEQLESFNMTLAMTVDFEMFNCPLVSLSSLKSFGIQQYSCCSPYIDLSTDELSQLKSLLVDGCELKWIRDKKQQLKSDIEL